MTDALLSVNGALCTRIRLDVPARGPWVADVDVSDSADLAGAAVVVIGSLRLTGTVDPDHTGTFQFKTRARVVGGAGGWSKLITARHFHNDAGLKRGHVAQALAAVAGETLVGTTDDRLGVDWVTKSGTAGAALAALYPLWWVDYEGVTHVATARDTADLATAYDLIDFEPRTRIATLALDAPEALMIGSVLHDRLEAPARVRAFSLEAASAGMRVRAWTEAA